MQQECSESARERRIALYKRDHHHQHQEATSRTRTFSSVIGDRRTNERNWQTYEARFHHHCVDLFCPLFSLGLGGSATKRAPSKASPFPPEVASWSIFTDWWKMRITSRNRKSLFLNGAHFILSFLPECCRVFNFVEKLSPLFWRAHIYFQVYWKRFFLVRLSWLSVSLKV